MIRKVGQFFAPGFFPFTMGCFLIIFALFYRFFDLPSPYELSQLIINFYNKYGLFVLLVGAFLEALFMLSLYLPGSLVIFMAVIALGKDLKSVILLGVIIIIGYTLANIINYLLGRFGYYKFLLIFGKKDLIEKMKKHFESSDTKTVFLSSIHPNALSITFVCAGIGRYNFSSILWKSLISATFWTYFWILIVIFFSERIKLDFDNPNQIILFIIVFFLWGLFLCFKNYYRKSSKVM